MESVTKEIKEAEPFDINGYINKQFNGMFNIMQDDLRKLSKSSLNRNKQKAYGEMIQLVNRYRKSVNLQYNELKSNEIQK